MIGARTFQSAAMIEPSTASKISEILLLFHAAADWKVRAPIMVGTAVRTSQFCTFARWRVHCAACRFVDIRLEQRYVCLREVFVEYALPWVGARMPVWRFASIPG